MNLLPRAAAKVLAVQATVHAFASMVLAMPLSWLLRDATGSHPEGVRALFSDGSVFALNQFFKSAFPLTTAALWAALTTSALFFADTALTTRYLARLSEAQEETSHVRAVRMFFRVLATRVLFLALAGGVVALFGLVSEGLAPKLTAHASAKAEDIVSVVGYPIGLLLALPLVLLRDLWMTESVHAAAIGERLRRTFKAFRGRFFALTGHYLGRAAICGLLWAAALLFIRATDSVFLLVLLLIVSRVFVALRVVVRGSFYVQTTRALQGATAPR